MSDDPALVLCADIGGTNTRLALADRRAEGIRIAARQGYGNADTSDLESLIGDFLAGRARPAAACLAVAGPTDGRRVQLTNLNWTIDADRLGEKFGFPFRLINDFEAVAVGLDALDPDQVVTLQAGQPVEQAPRLALGPGTGLGVAHSIWQADGYRPVPGEGGHIAFAPADAEQLALLGYLQGEYGRVSVERILSGAGISALYGFCRAAAGQAPGPLGSPAEVSAAALDGSDPAADCALRLFTRILGQTAGDLALITGARGGVYLAGGIPPRILATLKGGEFLAGFRAKGRFSDWIQAVPVHVVTDPDVGLKGAALAAYSMPSRSTR